MSRRAIVASALVLGGCAGLLGLESVPDAPGPTPTDGGTAVDARAALPGAGDAGAPDGGVIASECPFDVDAGLGVRCGGESARCDRATGCCSDISCKKTCLTGPGNWACESAEQCKDQNSAGGHYACCTNLQIDAQQPTCPRAPVTSTGATSYCQRYLGDADDPCNGLLHLCRPSEGEDCPNGTVCTGLRLDGASVVGEVGVCLAGP